MASSLEEFFVVEKIMLLLNQEDALNMSAVCRRWRQVAETSEKLNSTINVEYTPFKSEEKLESFVDWIKKRSSLVEHLLIAHQDHPSHNQEAYEALLAVSGTLKTFTLDLDKRKKNRRGLPGPANIAWLPTFPNLKKFTLIANWRIAEDWKLANSMPNLEILELDGTELCIIDEYEPTADQFPPCLQKLVFHDVYQGVPDAVSRLVQLKELSLQHSISNPAALEFNQYSDKNLASALIKLTELTKLELDTVVISTVVPAETFTVIRKLPKLACLCLKYVEVNGSNNFRMDNLRKLLNLTCRKLRTLTELRLFGDTIEWPSDLALAFNLKTLEHKHYMHLGEMGPPLPPLDCLQRLSYLAMPYGIFNYNALDVFSKSSGYMKNLETLQFEVLDTPLPTLQRLERRPPHTGPSVVNDIKRALEMFACLSTSGRLKHLVLRDSPKFGFLSAWDYSFEVINDFLDFFYTSAVEAAKQLIAAGIGKSYSLEKGGERQRNIFTFNF